MKTRPNNLSCREEWNFSECPSDQLRWCDVYEHAREDLRLIEEVEAMRCSGHWSQAMLDRFIDSRYASMGQMLFTLFPEFPGTPFLRLDAALRQQRCHQLNSRRSDLLVQFSNVKPVRP